MRMRGTVFSGSARGAPLIKKYYARLIGILGVKLFLGTLNVRLDNSADIRPYSRKSIDHILQGGRRHVDAHIATVKIRKLSQAYAVMEMRAASRESIKRLELFKETAKEKFNVNVSDKEISPGHECWAMQFIGDNVDKNVLEIVSKDNVRDLLDLHDGDTLEMEFFEKVK